MSARMSRSVSVPALSSRRHHLGLLMALFAYTRWTDGFPSVPGPPGAPGAPDPPRPPRESIKPTRDRAPSPRRARAPCPLAARTKSKRDPVNSRNAGCVSLRSLRRIRAKPTLSQFESRFATPEFCRRERLSAPQPMSVSSSSAFEWHTQR